MTDVLERLRAADPLSETEVPSIEPVWAAIQRSAALEARRSSTGATGRSVRARILLLFGGLSVAAALVGVLLVRGGPSIAARAYAAIESSNAIVHYVEISHLQPVHHGFGIVDRRADVWVLGSQSHTVASDSIYSDGGPRTSSETEMAINGTSSEIYQSIDNSLAVEPRPLGPRSLASCASLTTCGFDPSDPLATLRRLYRTGQLHDAGHTTLDGQRLDVITAGAPAHVRILVDPTTFIPVQITQTLDSPSYVPFQYLTIRITSYQQLPINAQTKRLLLMRPHPHVRLTPLIQRLENGRTGHNVHRTR